MKRIFIISTIVLASCGSRRLATINNTYNGGITINGKMFATLYQQRSAEYRALCLQAFNIARLRLEQYNLTGNKPKAIITDIDETVLDNSAYEAHQTLQGKDYDAVSWLAWTDMSAADTVPGAAAFLRYAASKGIEIFYITNRDERERISTIKNLQKFGLPNADDKHFFPKQTTSGKEPRRQQIMTTHEVVMLVGDNLADFSSLFDKKQMDERLQNTDISGTEFGNRFIIIPNPVYGDWESSLYNYNYKFSPAQKDSAIRSVLKSY